MNPDETELLEFYESLNVELAYFPLTYERIINAKFLDYEYSDGKLIALSGIEKKHGFVRSWTIIKKEYWHQGINSKLLARRKEMCFRDKMCHVLLSIVDERNSESIKSLTRNGCKYIGRRGNLKYYLQPIRPSGNILISLAKLVFPLFVVIDNIRS
jgi:RimJ/RimL family protein N-acetyltransferase